MRSISPVIIRFAAAFLIAFFSIGATLEGIKSGSLDIYSLKVNILTRLGKSENYVDGDQGLLRLNILDNRFFHSLRPEEDTIFVFGTSVSGDFPDMTFSRNGRKYHVYNFSMSGNQLTGPVKIFAITSAFRPNYALFPLTPVQFMRPDFVAAAHGDECLGALGQLELPGKAFPFADTCNPLNPLRRSFSFGFALANTRKLLFYSNLDASVKARFDDRLALLRSLIASVGQDLMNSTLVLLGASSTAKIQAGHGIEVMDLGNLSDEAIKKMRADDEAALARYPDAPTPHPEHASDAIEKWAIEKPVSGLEPGGEVAFLFHSVANFAKTKGITLAFYNHPVAHKTPGMFPPGYYERWRLALAALAKRENVAYFDEGDIAIRKGSLWGDTIHVGGVGFSVLVRNVILEAVNSGLFDREQR